MRRLSDMNSELYLQDHTESIQANFVSAMELRNRIDSFMLLAFLDPYNQLLGNYTKLQQTLMFNVMDKSTAVTGECHESTAVAGKCHESTAQTGEYHESTAVTGGCHESTAVAR